MKKIIGILIVIVILVIFTAERTHLASKTPTSPLTEEVKTSTPTPSPVPVANQANYLFVPYWTMGKHPTVDPSYSAYIYFGLVPNATGIDETSTSYVDIKPFVTNFQGQKKTYLALEMTNQQVTDDVLKDKNLQAQIINETVTIARQNNFDGVVLDLEDSAIAFDSVITSISNFQKAFYTQTKANNLELLTTIYGDTYFRLRPYNVKVISQNSDKLLVMTYDFSKANGTPGPTFPYLGKTTYGYDYAQMLTDFTKDAPKQKLVIILGMFGYDWTLDSNGNSTGTATPVTYLQAEQLFFPVCQEKNCKVNRDNLSGEENVTYTDTNNQKHVVWFEDTASSSQKVNFAKEQGIPGIGYWAYSYF